METTTIILEYWNAGEYENHLEISVAGMDAPIRLTCSQPIDIGRGYCGAHFINRKYYTSAITGEKLCKVRCNACGYHTYRKVGRTYINGGA